MPPVYELKATDTDEINGAGFDFIGGANSRDFASVAPLLNGSRAPVSSVAPHMLPSGIIFHYAKPIIYHFQTIPYVPLVSESFRLLIEDLEPGIHDFTPVAASFSRFADFICEPHYFINIAKYTDGLNLENCPLQVYPPPPLPVGFKSIKVEPRSYLMIGGRGKVFLSKQIILRHLWRFQSPFALGFPTFLSSQLLTEFKSRAMIGLNVDICRPD